MSFPPTLSEAHFRSLPNFYQGKVRENYSLPDGRRLLITTDRQSAFDAVLGEIPYKGQVLNRFSAWWFGQTQDIVPNHLIEVVDPNVMLAKELTGVPVELVVRGYITGVTTTAAWYAYERGERNFCGNVLPEGLKKNQQLPEPIITPTTKEISGHDQKTSGAELVARGVVSQERWDEISRVAIALFKRGSELAREKGYLLVDTKYEFGLDEAGTLHLMDEVHTPDSSRYWKADSYQARFEAGEEPEYYDKEYLRLWLREQGFMGEGEIPTIPDDFRLEFAERYIKVFEDITGERVDRSDEDPKERIRQALAACGWV